VNVRAQIEAAAPQIAEMAKIGVVEAVSRGGRYKRGFG
jgi:hypothetical protein